LHAIGDLTDILNMQDRNMMHSQRAVYAVRMSSGLVEEAHDRQVAGLKKGTESPMLSIDNIGDSGRTSVYLCSLFNVGAALIARALSLAKNYPPALGECAVRSRDDPHPREPHASSLVASE
jgi:hypothetical protein